MSTETSPVDAPETEALACAFCENVAVSRCGRCNRPHCTDHGGRLCDACSAPDAGLPSRPLLLGIAGALGIGALFGVWLLFASPRLPGETPPPAGASQPRPDATSQPPRAGSPAATPGAATPAAGRKYAVKAGDTMGLIAQSFSISVEALVAANPGIQPDSLQIGQELTIPPAP